MIFYEVLDSECMGCAKSLLKNPSMCFADITDEMGFPCLPFLQRLRQGLMHECTRLVNAYSGKEPQIDII